MTSRSASHEMVHRGNPAFYRPQTASLKCDALIRILVRASVP